MDGEKKQAAELSDKPWCRLTEAERAAWRQAAERGPQLFGGATVSAEDFHAGVTASWRRKERHTY